MMRASAAVWRSACIGALLVAAGCASLDRAQVFGSSMQPQVLACADWYASLDSAVSSAGVGDAQTTRVEGFPYLRTDRFSASLGDAARADDATLAWLVDHLAALDLAARAHEISNLPQTRRKSLVPVAAGAPAPLERSRECSRILRDADMQVPAQRSLLLERLRVPDDYVTGYRVAGLYALTKLPFSAGVRRHLEETRAAFQRDLSSAAQGLVKRYVPSGNGQVTRAEVRNILANAARGPLRVPEPQGGALNALFSTYAPSFDIVTTGRYDEPGALHWGAGPLLEVDASAPVVYAQAAHTRYGGITLLQLVYTLWFSERPAQAAGDLLAGPLDGVVVRVTLAPDGSPLVYDTMHPCGCYHMFFTTPRAVPVTAPAGEPEWAFVPQTLPAISPGERLVLRIASRTHYVERVFRDPDADGGRYEFRTYDSLRSLPVAQGGTRSAFGPDGLIAGTDRPESWLFWPMGIANAGAMRQWGRHATAFVGRRHFDDADLLERRFILDLQ